MPIIKIDMIQGKTQEQKKKIVQEITQTMVRVVGDKPEDVRIIITEHSMENLAAAGQLLSDNPPRGLP